MTHGYRDEDDFQGEVLRVAAMFRWTLAYHTRNSRRSAAGFPDLVLARPSTQSLIVAELKMPGKQPTPEQRAWLGGFARAGVPAYVWRPGDEAALTAVLRAGR